MAFTETTKTFLTSFTLLKYSSSDENQARSMLEEMRATGLKSIINDLNLPVKKNAKKSELVFGILANLDSVTKIAMSFCVGEDEMKPNKEASKEVEEASNEVEEASNEVKEPSNEVDETSNEIEETSNEVEEDTKEPSKEVGEPRYDCEEYSKYVASEEYSRELSDEPSKEVEEYSKEPSEESRKDVGQSSREIETLKYDEAGFSLHDVMKDRVSGAVNCCSSLIYTLAEVIPVLERDDPRMSAKVSLISRDLQAEIFALEAALDEPRAMGTGTDFGDEESVKELIKSDTFLSDRVKDQLVAVLGERREIAGKLGELEQRRADAHDDFYRSEQSLMRAKEALVQRELRIQNELLRLRVSGEALDDVHGVIDEEEHNCGSVNLESRLAERDREVEELRSKLINLEMKREAEQNFPFGHDSPRVLRLLDYIRDFGSDLDRQIKETEVFEDNMEAIFERCRSVEDTDGSISRIKEAGLMLYERMRSNNEDLAYKIYQLNSLVGKEDSLRISELSTINEAEDIRADVERPHSCFGEPPSVFGIGNVQARALLSLVNDVLARSGYSPLSIDLMSADGTVETVNPMVVAIGSSPDVVVRPEEAQRDNALPDSFPDGGRDLIAAELSSELEPMEFPSVLPDVESKLSENFEMQILEEPLTDVDQAFDDIQQIYTPAMDDMMVTSGIDELYHHVEPLTDDSIAVPSQLAYQFAPTPYPPPHRIMDLSAIYGGIASPPCEPISPPNFQQPFLENPVSPISPVDQNTSLTYNSSFEAQSPRDLFPPNDDPFAMSSTAAVVGHQVDEFDLEVSDALQEPNDDGDQNRRASILTTVDCDEYQEQEITSESDLDVGDKRPAPFTFEEEHSAKRPSHHTLSSSETEHGE